MPALTVDEAREWAQQARMSCEQGSPATSGVSDSAIRHAIDLEIGVDLEEEDGDSASAEPSPRAAANASGYKVSVYEISDQNVFYDRQGVLKHVQVPVGFPK